MYTKRIVLFILLSVLSFSSQVWASEPSTHLIDALIQVESHGDDAAIGDTKRKNKAYGCLQIRKPVVEDVNRVYGTKYRAEDCRNNRELSIKICKLYIKLYATKKRLGHEPTDEEKARIWNGGPNGHEKSSTDEYWAKVKEELKD